MSRADHPGRASGARPTAPARRRALAEAAAVEFHRRGFHQVTLSGVAAAVGVTAPAVYRHYANKNALLAGAIESGIEEVEAALHAAAEAGGDLDDVLVNLTIAALRRPDFWTLSQREMRYLRDEERERARARFHGVADELSEAIGRRRPEVDHRARDVLVTATMAALSTPFTHLPTIPPTRRGSILTAAAEAACWTALPPAAATETAQASGHERPSPTTPADRSSQIRDTAFALFHRRGYAAVSLDDIGAAVGIAGPSIYHHYASKTELLVAAFDRVLGALPRVDPDTDPTEAMRSYIDLARREREAIGTVATETINLPVSETRRIECALADDLAAWTAMLRHHRPEVGDPEAALLVQAARGIVHDVVRLGRLHRRPNLGEELLAITTAVLAAPITTENSLAFTGRP